MTNASTTQLLDAATGTWATGLIKRLSLPDELFPPLRSPGESLGRLSDDALRETRLTPRVNVSTVASHDTASAVVAVPANDSAFAYISCGTWALVGVELDHPVVTEDSRRANFSNELGIDGTVRLLRNEMGLWLLDECRRSWAESGRQTTLSRLLEEARRVPARRSIIDTRNDRWRVPRNMPERIAEACRGAEERVPKSPAEVVRCILDSLAVVYSRAIQQAHAVSRISIERIHLVGGGARN